MIVNHETLNYTHEDLILVISYEVYREDGGVVIEGLEIVAAVEDTLDRAPYPIDQIDKDDVEEKLTNYFNKYLNEY